MEKEKFFKSFTHKLNIRQHKVISRIFKVGYTSFIVGLSAEKYTKIAKTSNSTNTRDLKDLLDKGAFTKTESLKSTRYILNIIGF